VDTHTRRRTITWNPLHPALPARRNCRAILLQRSDRRKRELEDKGCVVKQRVGAATAWPFEAAFAPPS
jgi:hypothetical protein